MPSYSVRCVFLWHADDEVGAEAGRARRTYEERITLWRAGSFGEAIARAEVEADVYARETGCDPLGLCQAFELEGEIPSEAGGVEVFSLLRDSVLSPSDYLARYFDTGDERQRDI
jgi:hypothetical protein